MRRTTCWHLGLHSSKDASNDRADRDYDPNDAANRAAAIRQQKYEEVKALLLEQNELHCAPHSTLVDVLLA